MRPILFSLVALATLGCKPPDQTLPPELRDDDADGFIGSEDCDDTNAEISPARPEKCNGIDDNCDGNIDESGVDAPTWYADEDADGFGGPGTAVACAAPNGFVADGTDCDDTNPEVNPSADEVCNGIDDDCDGTRDVDATDEATFYADNDGDGYGTDSDTRQGCTAPRGYSAEGGDCNDAKAAISPGADEVCDGIDNNCDGTIDESTAVNATTWHADADGDGYGDPNPASDLRACAQPAGYVDNTRDCDDTNASANPGATEVCDGVDNDCDGMLEQDAADAITWYKDVDGDGYGVTALTAKSCTQPAGYVDANGDCNDASTAVNPGATEVCNTIDDNCDGLTDDATSADAATWYADRDGDTYGDASVSQVACTQPVNYVADSADCNDFAPLVNPAADEECDKVDNNCDGTVDEDSAIDAKTWYADADADGYGDPVSSPLVQCYAPTGYVADDTDCDDAEPLRNPGAAEVCRDGIDNNCNDSPDLCVWEGKRTKSSASVTITGDYNFGRSFAVGDYDGDGLTDVAIGNPYGDGYYGSVVMVLGDKDGDGTADLKDGTAGDSGKLGAYKVAGAVDYYTYFGWSVANAGDQDGDGIDDLLTGAWYESIYSSPSYYDLGSATVWLGRAGSDDTGDGKYDWTDLYSGDEYARWTGDPGYCYSYSWGSYCYGNALSSGTGAADVDGDGIKDMLIGAFEDGYNPSGGTSYYKGAVFVLYGGKWSGSYSMEKNQYDARVYGEYDYDYLGGGWDGSTKVAGVGDMDGDGYDESIAGAYYHNYNASGSYQGGNGVAYLVYGDSTRLAGDIPVTSVASARIYGSSSYNYLGAGVNGVGDVDGDGYDDAAVGAWGANGYAGAAYVFAGGSTRWSGRLDAKSKASYVLNSKDYGYSGWSVAGHFDLDADGNGDFAVGAYYSYGPSGECCGYGRADVVLGPLDSSTYTLPGDATVSFYGESAYEYFGGHVEGLGDINDDGYGDLVIGGPYGTTVGIILGTGI